MHTFQPFGASRDSRTPSPNHPFKSAGQSELEVSPVPTTSLSSSSSPASQTYDFVPLPDPTISSSTPNPLEQTHSGFVDSTSNVPRIVSATQVASEDAFASTNAVSESGTTEIGGGHGEPIKSKGTTGGETTVKRRQKRLERNRESARLSRRRRKQYLEILEENVNKLSHEMDQGRREHVSRAVWTVQNKRLELLVGSANAQLAENPHCLEKELSRTSDELKIVNTFQSQQLKSFTLPPSTKYTLWLTLQNDAFFRGGRASSERLSAARIGERMLSSGTDRVTPAQSMWPLFCNEVGLSYEQEEKVRSYQRTLLQNQESWLHRHSAFATARTMQSLHDAAQALTLRMGQRERSTHGALSAKQRTVLATWATRNRERLAREVSHQAKASSMDTAHEYETSTSQHVAANLYTLNHQLQTILKKVPPAAPLVTGKNLMKFSRRPLFESLGCRCNENEEGMSREKSFGSTGSLKRSVSEISMEGEERPHIPPVAPEEAQAVATHLIEKTLGHLKDIIPAPPAPAVGFSQASLVLPSPTPVSSMKQQSRLPYFPTTLQSAQVAAPPSDPHHAASETKHQRKSSFLPPHLNVVPEEMWPADESDEFLMNLIDDEDWAIGEGIDMEILH